MALYITHCRFKGKIAADMSFIFLQKTLPNKHFRAAKLLHTLHCRITHSSSSEFRQEKPTICVHKALEVLPIIASERKPGARTNQRHLCLIEDILQTASGQVKTQSLCSDLINTSKLDFKNLLEDNLPIEAAPVNNESLASFCSSVDAKALSIAVSSCASKRDLRSGIQYHCLAIRIGFIDNVYVGSSLISFYSRCGQFGESYKVFDEMPMRNVVSWTAIISGFAQEWDVDSCLMLYSEMRVSGLKPNDYTFTSLLSGCSGNGALEQGRSVHCQVIQMGFNPYTVIANALLSMYCKCGSVESAVFVFENMADRDIVSWNSMIAGFAQHGMAAQAIELFEKMEQVRPDTITFLGVLSSCRHAGLVNEGRKYFNLMTECGVKPELDHYSCIVDLLGRAKLLEEARDLILKMPMPPNAVIWGSLLSSCRLHRSVWIGIEAAENRLLLEPDCATTHVQLANLYASVRRWDQASRVRKLMKDRGLKTSPGYSWIEIKNEVHRFRVEDMSSSRLTEVLEVLDCLIEQMTVYEHFAVTHEDLSRMSMLDEFSLICHE